MTLAIASRLRSFVALLLLSALAWLAGCDNSGASTESAARGLAPRSYPYQVVATIGMVADIVQHVADDRAQVTALIGSGVDPHLYKPTAGDVKQLMAADVVFYSGLMLEGKMTDTLVKVGRSKPVFAVTERIDEAYLLEPQNMQGHFDPHVWMDVAGWIKAVEAVRDSLTDYDPPGAEHYQNNAQTYIEELQRLDGYVRQVIGSIPEAQRVLITAHDAFNYFGRAYNIRVMGIQGLSTESEAGVDDINNLVQFIVDHDIKAVFVETSVSDKNVRALIEGAASRGRQVSVGGSLYSDAMGPANAYEGTYVGMIDHNATLIARALGGDAPPGGMQGKLGTEEAR